MTATCRVCHAEIALRYVGTVVVWGHLVNPRDEHHYAAPGRDALRAAVVELSNPPGRRTDGRPEGATALDVGGT